jgi:hypothetical protein
MSISNNFNSSLNTLLASFTHIDPDSMSTRVDSDFVESICIDTSNTRIGINTLDPSYSLHIMDYDYSGNMYVSEFTCISSNINSIIDINTIKGINLLFDVSKIDISGTIDLSYSYKPKFFIPSSRDDVSINQLYYDLSSNNDGILMIKLSP